MAEKPANGQLTWETPDWALQGVQDAVYSRGPQANQAAVANLTTNVEGIYEGAYIGEYAEAYNWGQWYQVQFRRNSI
jgi:hypothetical protein